MGNDAPATIVFVGRADAFTAALARAFAAEKRRIAVLHDGGQDYAAVLASEVARSGAICLPLTLEDLGAEQKCKSAGPLLKRVGEAFGRLDAIVRVESEVEMGRISAFARPDEANTAGGDLPHVPALMQAIRDLPRALRRSVRALFWIVAGNSKRADGGAVGATSLPPAWEEVRDAAAARSAPGATALLVPQEFAGGENENLSRALAERIVRETHLGGPSGARVERLVAGPDRFHFEAMEF